MLLKCIKMHTYISSKIKPVFQTGTKMSKLCSNSSYRFKTIPPPPQKKKKKKERERENKKSLEKHWRKKAERERTKSHLKSTEERRQRERENKKSLEKHWRKKAEREKTKSHLKSTEERRQRERKQKVTWKALKKEGRERENKKSLEKHWRKKAEREKTKSHLKSTEERRQRERKQKVTWKALKKDAERGVGRESTQRSSFMDEKGPSSTRCTNGTVSKSTLGKLQRDWVEDIMMGFFSKHIDTILIWTYLEKSQHKMYWLFQLNKHESYLAPRSWSEFIPVYIMILQVQIQLNKTNKNCLQNKITCMSVSVPTACNPKFNKRSPKLIIIWKSKVWWRFKSPKDIP